jgi:hypothetical protein
MSCWWGKLMVENPGLHMPKCWLLQAAYSIYGHFSRGRALDTWSTIFAVSFSPLVLLLLLLLLLLLFFFFRCISHC